MLDVGYYLMVRNLSAEDREALETTIYTRPEPAGDGPTPPRWWKGEDDAAATAAAFFTMMGGSR